MRFAAWREPRAAARIARALWIVWAIVVWNVVLDHVIVSAGRGYVAAAARAAAAPAGSRRYEDMDAWMRPAMSRGLALATAASAALVTSGLVLVRAAARLHPNREPACP